MTIQVEIDDAEIEKFARARVRELFSEDARLRQTSAQEYIRKCVDSGILNCQIPRVIAEKMAFTADRVLNECVENALRTAMRREVNKALKLGVNIEKLTPQERAWFEEQAAKNARLKNENVR